MLLMIDWNPEFKFHWQSLESSSRIQNPRMSYSLTWGDLEDTSKKTWQTGNNLLQNFGSERVKHFPQGYPQFITESLKEEQKEHS